MPPHFRRPQHATANSSIVLQDYLLICFFLVQGKQIQGTVDNVGGVCDSSLLTCVIVHVV